MPTDYGTDMSGDTDLTPTLLNISGLPMMVQVCCRRLFTPSGSLLSAPSAKTIDLRDYLSITIESNGSNTGYIRTAIVSALLDDPRIFSVVPKLTFDAAAQTMFVEIRGVGAEGPFALTLSVNSVTVELLKS